MLGLEQRHDDERLVIAVGEQCLAVESTEFVGNALRAYKLQKNT